MLFDDNTVRIAAIGDASKVRVWRVVGEGHVRTELLETGLALGAVAVESTMQPTAARSPGLKLVTAEPTLVTRPTISCPGTHG